MPSQRKRIGFLPSEEVHEIIDKLCKENEFSQSKVTGLLVEEALRSRGVLDSYFATNRSEINNFISYSFEQERFFKKNKFPGNSDDYIVDKRAFTENIKMMHEFIEFKLFKNVMMRNNTILE